MSQAQKNWKGKTGGGTIGQKALLVLFRFFDLRVGYILMSLVIPFYLLFGSKARHHIYQYFRMHHRFSKIKSIWMCYKNHLVFGKIILDRFAIFSGKAKFFKLEKDGYDEYYMPLAQSCKGFIMVSAHIGNFEAGGYLLNSTLKPMNVLVYNGESKTVLENRKKVLDKHHINMIAVGENTNHLYETTTALEQGEIINIVCDRSVGSPKTVPCCFLNEDANIPIGAFALSAQLQVPVISVFIMKKNTRTYKAYIRPVSVDNQKDMRIRLQINKMAQQYVANLEEVICKYPDQWFNYYDFWKK